jgi:hypothetical protein
MSDNRSTLERELERLSPSRIHFEQLVRRRDRKRRNQRIAAGVVGIAVFVAAVWIVTTAGSFDRTTPADKPTVNTAEEEVARGFLDALAAFDAQKAMSYVADDADLTGLIGPQVPADTEGLSLMLSLFEAWGSKLILTSCETVAHESDTSVVCDFDFHGLRSDEIGRGPFSGGSFVITVRDGAIIRAWVSKPPEEFERQMWEPFAEWVSSTYPKDAAVMYLDGMLQARLSPESIRLWERHTREYVETRSAETGPAETAPPPASDITSDGPLGVGCSADAGVHLVIKDIGDRIAVRFEVHRSPVGHSWQIVLLHDEADVGGGGFHWDRGAPFFEGTSVASDSGDLVVQRSVVDQEWVDGFRAEAVDRQTGQVCRQSARGGSASI